MVSFVSIPESQTIGPHGSGFSPATFSLKPGDASQVEQKAQKLMAIALGMKPSWIVGTEKQHCSAFYITCPCGEEEMSPGN